MNAPCLVILIVIKLSKIANCCLLDISMAVDDAFVSCSTNNVSCVAECYRGYILPNGSTKESYSCLNGVLTITLSSCRRIPLVSVTYSASWDFPGVLTSACKNISLRLDSLQELLEETLVKSCQLLNVNTTAQFKYTFLDRKVHIYFKAVYHNFTNWKELVVCTNYTKNSFHNLQVAKSMFEGVTCGNLNTNNTIDKSLHVLETHFICLNDTKLHNVTNSDDGIFKRYCDVDTIVATSKLTTKTAQSGMNTAQSLTLKAEVSYNDNDSNISTIATIIAFSSERDLKVKILIYITASTGGAFLISLIISFIVCQRKRIKFPENLTDDINLTPETNHMRDETSFKGELIENELYKSADDVLEWGSTVDNIKAARGDFSAAQYFKEKTEKQPKVDHQDEYSCPFKISKGKEARLHVAFTDEA